MDSPQPVMHVQNSHRYQKATMLALGYNSGLPILLISGTLQIWLHLRGMPLDAISQLTLISLPYALKWLIGLMIDTYHIGKGYSHLSLSTAWAMIILIGTLGMIKYTILMIFMSFVLAMLSACHDVAIDAYRLQAHAHDDYIYATLWFQNGYRLGMAVAGGMAFVLTQKIGLRTTCITLALSMLPGVCLLGKIKPLYHTQKCKITQNIKDIFTWLRACHWPVFGLIITLAAIEYLPESNLSYYLMHFGAMSLTTIGLIQRVMALIAIILGTMLSSKMARRLGLTRTINWIGYGACLSILPLISIQPHAVLRTIACILLFSFFKGASCQVIALLIYSQCKKNRMIATQTALLSGFSGWSRSLSGPIAGHMISSNGWYVFFLSTCIVGMLMLYVLQRPMQHYPTCFDTLTHST